MGEDVSRGDTIAVGTGDGIVAEILIQWPVEVELALVC